MTLQQKIKKLKNTVTNIKLNSTKVRDDMASSMLYRNLIDSCNFLVGADPVG
jgi:hypothetical protein